MEEYKALCLRLICGDKDAIFDLQNGLENQASFIYSITRLQRQHIEDELGQTLLHIVLSTWVPRPEIDERTQLYTLIEELIKTGINVNAVDSCKGYIALHYAVEKGLDMKVLTLLLSKGFETKSSTDVVGLDGKTPLDLMSERLRKEQACAVEEKHGGSVVTFGKSDLQLGYITKQNVQHTAKRVKFLKYHGNDLIAVAAARFHTVAVSIDGSVYTWGQGNGGKLGHGDETTYILPTRVEYFILPKRRVVKVAAGRDHTLALCADGDVYSWGCDRYGQLGLGLPCNMDSVSDGNESAAQAKIVSTPRRVKMKSQVTDIATSTTHSLCISVYGVVYSWGLNDKGQLGYRATGYGPEKSKRSIPSDVDIFQVRDSGPAVYCAAADGVSCIVTKHGSVWQWGRGSPNPYRVHMKSDPGELDDDSSGWQKSRENVRIVQIATGPHHSCAISDGGHIYTWGTSAELLGHSYKGKNRNAASHTTVGIRVEALVRKGCYVISASCSKRHTCAVDNTGRLWVWGYGDHGILGMGETYQPSPRCVPELRKVSSCCAADSHTVAVVAAFRPPLSVLTSPKNSCLDSCDDAFAFDDDYASDDFGEHKLQKIAPISHYYKPESLSRIAEKKLASSIDIWNALHIWGFARMIHQDKLAAYCCTFVVHNLDGVLIANPGCDMILAEFFDCALTENRGIAIDDSESIVDVKLLELSRSRPPETLNFSKSKDSNEEARRKLRQLEKKLRILENDDLKFTAVKSKVKRVEAGLDKSALEIEIMKLKETLGFHSNERQADKDLYCKLCDIRVPDEFAMVDHVAGKKHRKLAAKRNPPVGTTNGVAKSSSEARPIPILKTDASNTSKGPMNEYGSSLESNSSWGSPMTSSLRSIGKMDLKEIMNEEEKLRNKKKAVISPVRNFEGEPSPGRFTKLKGSPFSLYDPSASFSTSPAKLEASSGSSRISLSSYVKKEAKPQPRSWGCEHQSTSFPLIRPTLHDIQAEQSSVISKSLKSSSWGRMHEQQVKSVVAIQTEQFLEREEELLAQQVDDHRSVKKGKQSSPLVFRRQRVGSNKKPRSRPERQRNSK